MVCLPRLWAPLMTCICAKYGPDGAGRAGLVCVIVTHTRTCRPSGGSLQSRNREKAAEEAEAVCYSITHKGSTECSGAGK